MSEGRPNQRRRTRKDLLQAAARLLKQGKAPTLEDVAAEAMVSRATAYRYFPNIEALLIEAPLDTAVPEPDEVFRDAPKDDPIARMDRVDAAFESMMSANEPGLRMMLSNTVLRPLRESEDGELPKRQNRRSPLIEAALEPARKELKPADAKLLAKALALVIGTEAMIVFKDVLQTDESEARKVRRWMIRALVNAARK
ncbi:helix-turn-helix domain-containing protein [Vitreimonas sp.]|jgi:AcrR family transcriptional regulator|uniref:TetR/AcrR family transcriptional regulator n=1 Tax=Vitreimonas sp. TaxID=3069702 RepID=UPI002EDA18FA